MKKFTLTILSSLLAILTFADTFIVTDSSGFPVPNSISDAISQANVNPGSDTILFNLPLDRRTIRLSAVLSISGDSTILKGDIDGDGIPDIELSGTPIINAFSIESEGNLIEGFIINDNFMYGIFIDGSAGGRNNRIYSNYIGTDRTGTFAMANVSDGIKLDSSNNNKIGDGSLQKRNIISGNFGMGIRIINGDSNLIAGNFIGMDNSGINAIPNFMSGIYLSGCRYNIIGGNISGYGNLISGNFNHGIEIDGDAGDGAINTKIIGNLIGTDISGLKAAGNTHGINLTGFSSNMDSIYIGDGTISGRNIISGNMQNGIMVTNSSPGGPQRTIINNNLIGVGIDGKTAIPNQMSGIIVNQDATQNRILNNIIAYNSSKGILFDGLGTINNTLFNNSIHHNGLGIDITGGAQENVLPPTIDSMSLDSTLHGIAAPNALIQLYADSFDQGQFFIDTVRAMSSGVWTYKLAIIPHGLEINAIQDSAGNTSMFSNSLTKFYLDGQVFNGSFADTVKIANIFIYSVDVNSANPYTIANATSVSEPPFQFLSTGSGVFPGKYLVYAVPDIDTYPNTIPTYYPDKTRWTDAVVVTLTKDTFLSIVCSKVVPISGTGLLKGRVVEGVGLNINKVQGPGDPFNGIDVSLIDKSTGSAVAITSTDDDTTQGIGGRFQFDNVTDGDYLIHLDIAGVPIETPTFTISGGSTLDNIIVTADSNLIYFGTESGISNPLVSNFNFDIYPNPSKDKIVISYYLEKEKSFEIRIFDIRGKEQYLTIENNQMKGLHKKEIELADQDFANGIFFINFKIGVFNKTKQFIIIK